MPTISKTLSEENATRVADGLCALHGYKEKIENSEKPTEENAKTYESLIDNPETKIQFAQKMIWQAVKRDTLRGEAIIAKRALSTSIPLEL